MAYRPDLPEFDKPLNQDKLKDLHRLPLLLSPLHAQEAYRRAHQQCAITGAGSTHTVPA